MTKPLRPRTAERIRVDFDAFVRFDRFPELPVYIEDFSSSGFRCRCTERLRIGSRVILRIPQVGQFPATIAWQIGLYAGARFDTPLPLQTVMAIVLAVMEPAVGATDAADVSEPEDKS